MLESSRHKTIFLHRSLQQNCLSRTIMQFPLTNFFRNQRNEALKLTFYREILTRSCMYQKRWSLIKLDKKKFIHQKRLRTNINIDAKKKKKLTEKLMNFLISSLIKQSCALKHKKSKI